MFGYMTDLNTVEESDQVEIEVEAEELEPLLFQFLDDFLYNFSAEPFIVCKRVQITEFDREKMKIKAIGYGETFNLDKHPQVEKRNSAN